MATSVPGGLSRASAGGPPSSLTRQAPCGRGYPQKSSKGFIHRRRTAKHLGNVRFQIDGDIQFYIGPEELSPLSLREIIFLLHGSVSSYCRVSLFVGLLADIMRILHSSAEISASVWTRTRRCPCLSLPRVTHRSSCSLCSSSRIETASGSRNTSAPRSKVSLCFRRFSLALTGFHSKV